MTSTDISSLYAKAQHVARRHYGCNIVRTEYYKELAARIVVAAVARYQMANSVLCVSECMMERNNIARSASFILQNMHKIQILYFVYVILILF